MTSQFTIYAPLTLVALAAVVLPLCWLLTLWSRYGVTGCFLLLSAWLYARAKSREHWKVLAADYRRQALAEIPRSVIDVPVRRRRSPSLLRRARKMIAACSVRISQARLRTEEL